MAMLITLKFEQTLNEESQIRARLAAASLAKCNRMHFNEAFTEMYLSGEALSVERLQEAFAEQELSIQDIVTPLSQEENEAADDVVDGDKPNKERLRPIGR